MEAGIYFRVEREGRYKPVDILEMTEEEIEEALKEKNDAFLRRLTWMIVRWVQENVQEFEIDLSRRAVGRIKE